MAHFLYVCSNVAIYVNKCPTRCNYTQFICKLFYMFRVVSPPIISSTNNCIYIIWYWSAVVATGRYRGLQSHLLHDSHR